MQLPNTGGASRVLAPGRRMSRLGAVFAVATLTVASASLPACGPAGPDSPDEGAPKSPPPSDDTGYTEQDDGSLMLVRRVHREGPADAALLGVFVTNNYGRYKNLAACAILDEHCLEALPDGDDAWIDLGPEVRFVPELTAFRYVGLEVWLGPYKAHYRTTHGFPQYISDLGPQLSGGPIHGQLGVSVAGQWGPYEGERDLQVSGDIDLIRPEPDSAVAFTDVEDLVVEWVPSGEGDVYLTVTSLGDGPRLARMYRLLDDGHHRLTGQQLGLGTDDRLLEIRLARWNHAALDVRGHQLDLVATSEARFLALYGYVAGRDRLPLEDRCMTAHGLPPLQSGRYWGALAAAGMSDRLSNVVGCTGWPAFGAEGFARVELQPMQYITVAHTLLDDDASVYLVEDCTRGDTCVAGADDAGPSMPEYLSYFNNGDEPRTLFLGLDGHESTSGIFYLDVDIATLTEPEMADTCLDAQLQAPLGSGSYYATETAYTGLLDPGAGGCTGTPLTGPEAMTRISLQAGETLHANIQMPGGNPALYLLYNCTNATSCAAGRDLSVGAGELLSYTNHSGVSENLYLVVDTVGTTLRPYFLTIDIH